MKQVSPEDSYEHLRVVGGIAVDFGGRNFSVITYFRRMKTGKFPQTRRGVL
ncbi:MAG: hypothetical protein IJY47_07535 [Clostridia bacterium]|nr:hypothetical protein [Clostridia bacterium]